MEESMYLPFSKSTRYWNKSCTKSVCEKIPTRAVWSDLQWGKSISRRAFEYMYAPTIWQYFLSVGIQTRTLWKFKREFKECYFQNLLTPSCRLKFSWFVFCTVKENAALRSNLFMDWGHYRGHNVFKSILKENPFFVSL